jgi:TPR repeat protein
MPRVFISYRREDSVAYAGRLHDILEDHFGSGEVFIDIAALKPGEAFPEVLVNTVSACTALVAVIGPKWLAADENGGRRLDDPDDFVRVEIVTALKKGITVIPALVAGAKMPPVASLPVDLQPLAFRNAITLPDTGFRISARELIGVLNEVQDFVPPQETFEERYFREAQAAAESGSPDALARLGRLYFDRRDYAQARHWFQNAATAGYRGATDQLIKVDEWERLESEAASGNTASMIQLGWLCETEVMHREQAAHWYQKASDLGDANAMNELGEFYEQEKNYQTACEWYEKAIEGGSIASMTNLGQLYQDGHGVLHDDWRARQYYEKAAATGDGNALHNLGLMYQIGIGVEPDLRVAYDYFERATSAGYGPPYGRSGRIEKQLQRTGLRSGERKPMDTSAKAAAAPHASAKAKEKKPGLLRRLFRL